MAARLAALVFATLLIGLTGLCLPDVFSPDRDVVVVPLSVALGLWAALILPDRWREAGVAGFLVLALCLVLVGRWHAGLSSDQIIGGRLPFNDQQGYVVDALRLAEGHRLSPFSSRRPVHVLFLAAILKLVGGDLAVASVFLCVLAALAVAALAVSIRRSHDRVTAVVVALLSVLFYRRFIGTGLSEQAGFILGCLAAALLWRGAGTHARKELYGGAFLLTLALVARAGCFFVLPFVVLWVGWLCRCDHRRL
ncbi:MAG: hypothetical protein IRY94_17340, partial [Rhodospirillaceae bacterium]|nr:hypothetical protein [Rhodospirillaceae bacterium]